MFTKKFAAPALALVLLAASCGSGANDARTTFDTPPVTPAAALAYESDYVSVPSALSRITSFVVPGGGADEIYFLAESGPENASVPFKTTSDGTEIAALPDYAAPYYDDADATDEPDADAPKLSAAAICAGEDGIWIAEYGFGGGENRVLLRQLDNSGSELARLDVSESLVTPAGRDVGIDGLTIDPDGNFYILDTAYGINVLDKTGEFLTNIERTGIISLVTRSDGSVISLRFDMATFDAVVAPVNLSTGGWGTSVPGTKLANNIYPAGGEYDLLAADTLSVYGCKPGAAEPEKLLDWISAGIDPAGVTALAMLADGRIICAERGRTAAALSILSLREAAPAAERIVLKAAIFGVNVPFRNGVNAFNSKNGRYEVEVVEYDDGGKQFFREDYSAELAAFNAYLVSNDPPDIIIAPWMFPYDSYMEKGVFEDLYPYLDADSELSGRDALVPEALRALDTDGRLYQIASHFSIDTAFGMRAVLGDRTSWTVDEMLAVYDALPEGSGLFANMSAEEALLMLVEADTGRYIDFKNGKCYFDGGDFIQLLKFSRLLPNTPPLTSEAFAAKSREERMASGQAIHDGYVAVSDGKTLAVDWSVRSFLDAQGISRAFGGDIVFAGHPRAEGSGSSFSLSSMMLMSSRSRYKDGAWEFLRSFLTYEAQSAENYMTQYSPGFPIDKAALDNLITQSMTPKFEAGDTGERIEVPFYYGYYGLESCDIYAASQAEIDQILSLIADAGGLTRKDNFVSAIITEEAAPFFAGQKNAEDAARIIQSRVSLYVGERS
ncbi:MAG: hypothetical protein LBK23_09905 [Oscillospiraceae bacterium]|jgi:ABC-type glycerol-3-phosphate transport system substrate-binding protein|nr:hypothetical protein [Oscillospiraceae bacterium]